MKTIITFTDELDGKISLSMEMDPVMEDGPDQSITPATVMGLGVRLLFESGDVWEAGCIATHAISNGEDPAALAREIAAMRSQEKLDEELVDGMKSLTGVEDDGA